MYLDEGKFRELIESVKVGVYMANEHGNLFYVNSAFVEMLGYKKKDEVIGLNLAKELYIDARERALFLRKMDERGFVKDYEVRNKRQDGSEVVLSATSNYIRDEHGKIKGIEGVVQNITETKELSEALFKEKRKLEEILLFDEQVHTLRGMEALTKFMVEKVANILEVEKCSLMLVEESSKELFIQAAVGLNKKIIKSIRVKIGEPIAGVVALERKPFLVKNIEYDKKFGRANGPNYSGRSFICVPMLIEQKFIGIINVADKKMDEPFSDIDLRILGVIAREISVAIDNVHLYEELNSLSITDPLTQIYNYRQFVQALDFEIKRFHRHHKPLCIMMLDIDGFKMYNDTFGHLEGDELLRKFGVILKKSVRQTDIVCRYGGDEFSVILTDTDIKGVKIVSEKILRAVEQYPFKQKITTSIGITSYALTLDAHEFIQRADKALYEAKHQGKNRACVLE